MANPIISLCWVWTIFFFASESDGFRDHDALAHHSPPAIFVFGDSLSDTGNLMAVFPFLADAENSPYGSTFFHAPSGRYSNGRLIIDFMASKWGFPFLEPYFKNIVPNYRRGINFAVSGATARNVTEPVPFFLPFQTDQFVRFKRSVDASLNSKHKSGDCLVTHVPEVKSFEDGLYMIFIGVNDILNSLLLNASAPPFVIEEIVPRVVSAISKAVQDLYKEGAKNFIVFNIPAIGCTPMVLTLGLEGPFNSTDGLGCLKDYNKVAEYSKVELEKALAILSHQIEDINIMVADIYGFMLKTIANPARYGFDDRTKFKACCGFGGDPFNYNPLIPCGGNPAAKACNQPSKYMSWNGLHFTDAFNQRFVEEMMKSTPFSKFY